MNADSTETREDASAVDRRRNRRMRLVCIATVGIVLIGSGVAYQYYWLARPIGDGPAGPPVSAESFREIWTNEKVMLLGVGDSVTAGLGASSPDKSYFARLANNPQDEFADMQGRCLSKTIPNLEIKNFAVSGSNSIQHLRKLETLEAAPEDVMGLVVMTSGGNDLIHWYGRQPAKEGAMYGAKIEEAEPWIEGFEQRLGEMLDLLDSKFPGGCKIFLGDIYDPTDGVGDAPSIHLEDWEDGLQIHAAYNQAIYRCVARRDNVYLVPMHATFLGHGSHCRQFWREHYRSEDPNYWYYSNVEDPNDRGYDALRRIFLVEIEKVLNVKHER